MAKIKIKIHRPWIPYIIFVLTLSLTILSTFYVSRATNIEDRLRFLNAVEDTGNTIIDRLNIYFTVLRGMQGLYAANGNLTNNQFSSYITKLNLKKNYPAAQGIGFIQTDSSLGGTLNNITTKYLYLSNNKFQSSASYNFETDPTIVSSLEIARDTGLPTMSGEIHVFISRTNIQSGFIIILPIYKDSTIPHSLDEKRNNLIGFMYIPFVTSSFFQGILGDKSLPQLLNLQVYDGNKITQQDLLYDSKKNTIQMNSTYLARYHTIRTISIVGETWTLIYSNHPQFDDESQDYLSVLILIGGLSVSIILFILSRSQYKARTSAEHTASELSVSQKELQKAIGLRDNFISIASHELKTPVTSLKVYAEVLFKQFNNGKDKQTSDYLSKIIKQIDKLTMLIQDLLNVTRIQSNQLTFRIEKFDLNLMAKEVIDNTQQIATRHKIILQGKISKNVWGDRDRINQVLINLLTNAMKYSPKSDKVIVTLKDSKSGALISVRDFGIGINKNQQKKIFGRFYRINDIHVQTFPGLGIGLFISQTIVKKHGSEIIIRSTKGEGSIFEFTLPYFDKSVHTQKIVMT